MLMQQNLSYFGCATQKSQSALTSSRYYTIITGLKKISENDLPSLSPYYPRRMFDLLPERELPQTLSEIVRCVEALFVERPEKNGSYYIPHKTSHLDHSIIYLKDRIVLLPKKPRNTNHLDEGGRVNLEELSLF